jgi:alcohol dehydrogenase (NADP+)
MKMKRLNNDIEMPTLGLGTWLSEAGDVYKIVKSAIKDGYRHIDCAACYGNEKEVGQALSELFEEGVVSRSELFITSKLWNNAHAPADVLDALKSTLSDLKLDYLDLYLIHWPVAFKKEAFFPETNEDYISLEELPIIDTYKEMEKAVQAGLVKSLGVSNFSIKKLGDLISKANIKPVVNQVENHPYLSQNSLLEFCNTNEIALTCYSPLGSSGRPPGMLAENEPSLLENKIINDLASKYQKSPAQVILNWSMSRGAIVIPKTVTAHRAIENFESQNFEMDSSDIDQISTLDENFRYVNGSFFTPEGGIYTLANLWDE